MDKEYLRIDYFFSYWIVIWFIIYYFTIKTNIVPEKPKKYIQKNLNPEFALYVALFENLCIFVYLLFHKPTITTVVKYIFVIIFLKVVPLYLLKNEKMVLPQDVFPVSILFILYNVYLSFLDKSLFFIYNKSAHYVTFSLNK
jgi:hypothetical protein